MDYKNNSSTSPNSDSLGFQAMGGGQKPDRQDNIRVIKLNLKSIGRGHDGEDTTEDHLSVSERIGLVVTLELTVYYFCDFSSPFIPRRINERRGPFMQDHNTKQIERDHQ
jgi:hypothetical protein